MSSCRPPPRSGFAQPQMQMQPQPPRAVTPVAADGFGCVERGAERLDDDDKSAGMRGRGEGEASGPQGRCVTKDHKELSRHHPHPHRHPLITSLILLLLAPGLSAAWLVPQDGAAASVWQPLRTAGRRRLRVRSFATYTVPSMYAAPSPLMYGRSPLIVQGNVCRTQSFGGCTVSG
jgi:hypothetical protein